MKKREKDGRFALTMMLSGIIFTILVVTIAVISVILYLWIRSRIMVEINDKYIEIGDIVITVGAASLIVGAGLTMLLSSIPLKPVNMVMNSLNRLGAGDYSIRIQFGKPFGRVKIVRQLTDSFNTMAEELENTEMLRSDFINNFSHEFKTPIVSIAGFAKLLKRGNLTQQQKAEYLDIIEEESLRLSYMATNVLNLTRVENQTILTDVIEYNLSEQLRSCILLLEGKWERKALEFRLEFGEYMIAANEELLKQVWINLIDNAVKFSPEGKEVELRISSTNDTITVSVINEGSEITPEEQKKIFNKFYQADESHSTEGNGIGLAVVKKVVDLHQGEVWVQSGNGVTAFMVELPKRRQRG